jgi:VanZ family protein
LDRTLNWKLRGFIIFVAWACLAAIALGTLSELNLIYRLYYLLAPFLNYPSMRTYATMEHLAAYAIVGILFSAVYPRSAPLVCIFLILFVAVLEAMQTFIPDRHGTLRDAAEKIMGGVAGVVLMTLALRWRKSRRVENFEPS